MEDIPEGYLFWPADLGGLALKSSFVNLYLIRDSITKSTNSHVEQFFATEEKAYARAKVQVDEPSMLKARRRHSFPQLDTFMEFEEFTQYRLQTSSQLVTAYMGLMGEPSEVALECTPVVKEAAFDKAPIAVAHYGRGSRERGGRGGGFGGRAQKTSKSVSLTPYQRWILELYASDMDSRFGELAVVEKGLLPTGLFTMFREPRFRWQSWAR